MIFYNCGFFFSRFSYNYSIICISQLHSQQKIMLTKKDNNIMQQSPLKQKEIQELGEKQLTAIVQLEYLFTYYASKFSRHNYRELSHKSFMDMMKLLLERHDTLANTRTQEERREQEKQIQLVEILFLSKRFKESMTFQQFLEMIPGIGSIVYKELKQEETFSMITKDLLNLYRREVEIKLSGKFINLDLNLQEKTAEYVMKLAPQFMKIYKMYFYHELNGTVKREEARDESQKAFFRFIKQFEVFPKLITAGGVCLIYKEVIDSPQTDYLDEELKYNFPSETNKYSVGMLFTLGKFITMLIAISKVTSEKIMPVEKQEEQEKMCFRSLLEYIEMAKVYKKEGHMKDSGKSFSFILLEEYPKEITKESKIRTFNDRLKEKQKKQSSKKESEFLRMLKKMEI